ncbi:GNAT family N-acetyltransferase [Mameliella alba]|nr:GNAT family N-acetyltransferase [Antarctobacter heliothermus]MBY6142787.1 GNAT family N-acetyltransferase [Mameliella alba]MCA0953488.1 GNAT family N-acetyltransferase [Mameliella alba]
MTGFTTRRLTVHPWNAALSDPVAQSALQDRLATMLTPAVLKHLPPDFAPDAGPDAMSRWIDQRAERAQVSLIEADHQLIGLLFLFRPDPSGPRHLGYLLDQSAWGKGYATELLHGLIDHLRTQSPQVIEAGVAMENPASARVLLKAGFTEQKPDNDIRRFRLELP